MLSVTLAYTLTQAEYEGTHAGLALAISVSAILNAWLLYRGLRCDGVISHSSGWSKLFIQVVGATLAMIICLVYMAKPLDWWISTSVLERSILLVANVVGGMVVYFAGLLVLGLRPTNLKLRSE